MTMIENDIVTLPAYWATALLNGDLSEVREDVTELEAFLRATQELEADGWMVVDIAPDEEPRFSWNYRLYGGTSHGGDVVDYIVIRRT